MLSLRFCGYFSRCSSLIKCDRVLAHKKIPLGLAFFFILAGVGQVRPVLAGPFNFNGRWEFNDSRDGSYRESLTHSYSLSLQQQLNEAITARESGRFNRNWAEGRGTNDLLDSSARLSLSNYLFRFDLSGTASQSRNTESPNQVNRSWTGTWTSAWQKDFWPSLRLSYDQSDAKDDEEPRTMDSLTTTRTAAIDWDLHQAQIFYNYNHQQTDDNVNASQTTSTTNFIRLTTMKTFWDNRLTVNFSQDLNASRQEFTTLVGASGTALGAKINATAQAAVDTTPGSGALPTVVELTDNDLQTAIGSLPTDPLDINIALRTSGNRTDRIQVYTSDDLGTGAGTAYQWDLYSSSDGVTWSLEVTNVSSPYNSSRKRFEIAVPGLEKNYLKVVVAARPVKVVNFTEAEAYPLINATSGTEVTTTQKNTNMLTDFGLSLTLSPDLSMSYSLSNEAGRRSPGPDRDRLVQSGNLNWRQNPYLSYTLNLSESRDRNGDNPKDINRVYSLNITSPPLPTVDISLGATRSETYKDQTRTSTSTTYSLYTTAVLFPDLDSSLDLSYSDQKNEEQGTTTKSLQTDLTLTARLTPRLTTSLRGVHNISRGEAKTESLATTLNLNWRPSDILSLSSSIIQQWQTDSPDSTGMNLSIAMAMTPKTQLSFGYGYTKQETVSQNFSLASRWTISQYLSMQANGAYQLNQGKEDQWNVNGQMNVNFSSF